MVVELKCSKKLIVGILSTFAVLSLQCIAAEIDVPKDELAQETVYPLFDRPVSVKNRNIQDNNTIDIGIYGGFAITEPIYNTTKYGLSLNYHLNEIHSVGFLWSLNSTGLSKDAEGLKSDFNLDFGRAPYPVNSIFCDYNYKMYYGKLSVTKNSVVNTSIYTSLSAGMINFVHKSYPAIAAGVGERFYLTNQLAFKVDLRLFINNAPIPFKTGALRIPPNPTPDPVPSYDSFSERLTYTTNLEFGLNYLF